MRFETNSSGFRFVQTFNAISIDRGLSSDTFQTVELRIPEFGYTANMPVVIPGFRSESDSELNDILNSLTEADQEAYGAFLDSGGPAFDDASDLETLIPDYEAWESGEREETAEDLTIMALQEIVWVISVHFRVPGACRSGS